MSYDVRFSVKVEGLGKYVAFHVPECDSPTYNVSKIFRKCMSWDYHQSVEDETGEWQTCYYPCDFVIDRIEAGIKEITKNKDYYRQFEPENKWGTVETVQKCLKNWWNELYEISDEWGIPLKYIYFSW